jgi:hypothetical protein
VLCHFHGFLKMFRLSDAAKITLRRTPPVDGKYLNNVVENQGLRARRPFLDTHPRLARTYDAAVSYGDLPVLIASWGMPLGLNAYLYESSLLHGSLGVIGGIGWLGASVHMPHRPNSSVTAGFAYGGALSTAITVAPYILTTTANAIIKVALG